MKRILTGAAAMRREDRLQQREDRLSTKNADLKAEVERLRKELIGVVAVLSAEVDFIASLTAENERLRKALNKIEDGTAFSLVHPVPIYGMGSDLEDGYFIAADFARAALQPKEETQ